MPPQKAHPRTTSWQVLHQTHPIPVHQFCRHKPTAIRCRTRKSLCRHGNAGVGKLRRRVILQSVTVVESSRNFTFAQMGHPAVGQDSHNPFLRSVISGDRRLRAGPILGCSDLSTGVAPMLKGELKPVICVTFSRQLTGYKCNRSVGTPDGSGRNEISRCFLAVRGRPHRRLRQ